MTTTDDPPECSVQSDGACCCTCAHHAPDMHHPETTGLRITMKRGYVCLAPEFDGVFSEWPAHGLCEMFDPAPEPAVPPSADFAARSLLGAVQDVPVVGERL